MDFLTSLRSSHLARAYLLLLAAGALCLASAAVFLAMHRPDAIVSGPGVTARHMLSDFAPSLAGTPVDTAIYILEGKEPGGTALLFGGTHPEEISGVMAAILVIENARVERGRLIVIPQTNITGFTYTLPLEAFAHSYSIETPTGPRTFRNGMRMINPVYQWPDPDIFVHKQSGRRLVGWEARNLNRNYPGDPSGRLTARLGAAIMGFAREQDVNLVYDMHEATPEYPVNNMMIAHERAFEIASYAHWGLQALGIKIDLQASPRNLHGLSHREFGDHTSAYAVLSETASPAKGRFRGALTDDLVVGGRDPNYLAAARHVVPGNPYGRLFVPFDENGHPLSDRTARNLATIDELLKSYNDAEPERPIIVSGIPAYGDVRARGLGPYLLPIAGE